MSDAVPSPFTRHARFVEMARAASLPRLLRSDLEVIRKSQEWLPKNTGESDEAYRLRMQRTFALKRYEEVCESLGDTLMAGEVAVEPPETSEAGAEQQAELDAEVQAWLEDFDLEGRTVEDWLYDAFQHSLDCGVVHCLSDHPPIGEASNRGEELAQGARPYAVLIPGDDVLQVETETVRGKLRPLRINIRKDETVTDGWGERVAERVLVAYAGQHGAIDEASRFARWELFERDRDGVEKVVGSGSYRPHVDIPIDTFYAKRTGFMMGRPALRGLAEKNAEHIQSGSSQRYNLDFARFAQLVGIGFRDEDKQQKKSGSAYVWWVPQGGDLKLVETSGNALGAGRQHLEDCKSEMDQLAQKPLQKIGPSTASEVAIEKGEASDSIEAWAIGMARWLDAILARFRLWTTVPGATPKPVGKAKVIVDKSLFVSPQQGEMMKFLRQNGDIDQATLLRALKEIGQLPAWLDVDQVIDATRTEAPKLLGNPFALPGAQPPASEAPPQDPPEAGEDEA